MNEKHMIDSEQLANFINYIFSRMHNDKGMCDDNNWELVNNYYMYWLEKWIEKDEVIGIRDGGPIHAYRIKYIMQLVPTADRQVGMLNHSEFDRVTIRLANFMSKAIGYNKDKSLTKASFRFFSMVRDREGWLCVGIPEEFFDEEEMFFDDAFEDNIKMMLNCG